MRCAEKGLEPMITPVWHITVGFTLLNMPILRCTGAGRRGHCTNLLPTSHITNWAIRNIVNQATFQKVRKFSYIEEIYKKAKIVGY